MKTDYTYIVLGLGGIGAGAAYWLARQAGREVLGLEQFEIGHLRGGSQDHSRIIRLSYHTPAYVELAKQAYQAWAVLEADAEEKLIVKTGGLDFAPRNAAIDVMDYSNSLTACGVPFEMLDATEIMYRWPQFHLTEDIHGLYQAESGIAPAAKCNAAHLRRAEHYGATLKDHSPVTNLRDLGSEIEVEAGGITYRCQKLVIAQGAWSNQTLNYFEMQLPLTVTREQVTYFSTKHRLDFQPDNFPVWIWMDEPCFYGFPEYGELGTKAAQDVGGYETTANTRTFDPDPANLERVQTFLGQYIPKALGPVLYTKTCLYTMPPDRDFIVDLLPGHERIAMAIGGGHAFKFASLLGKILSELAIEGKTNSDISALSMQRPILHRANPPKNFMV